MFVGVESSAAIVCPEYRIIFYSSKGQRAPMIAKLLEKEGIVVSRRGVDAFLNRVQQTGTITRRSGSGRPSKRTEEAKQIVEATMCADDETMVKEAQAQFKRSRARSITEYDTSLQEGAWLDCERKHLLSNDSRAQQGGVTVLLSSHCSPMKKRGRGKGSRNES